MPSNNTLVKRVNGCTPPGEYMCGLIIYVGVFGFPWIGITATEDRSVEIVNGNCDSILYSDPEIKSAGSGLDGFDTVYQTTYNTQLQLWASVLGMDDFENVNFLYNNQDWHYQSECTQGGYGFDATFSTLQCNFAC
ncbi:hypothetical protein SEPCBS119000_000548 [Sporothrix epigloea]|uniref:Uncharacterized protein n=1 Tax=Sporothrix epigloea TaxID=1892477 RepID=A0ABP0D9G5_9PEZI